MKEFLEMEEKMKKMGIPDKKTTAPATNSIQPKKRRN